MESQDSVANSGDQSSTLITNTSLDDRQASCECEEKSQSNSCESSTEGTGYSIQDNATNDKEDTTETSHEGEDKLDATLENVSIMDNVYLAASTAPEKKSRGAKSVKDEDMQRGHHQRGSSKKNKKKRGGFLSKRSFSEADRGSDTSKNGGRDARRTVSEDEDPCRFVDDDDDGRVDDETSRAITEIPEVTVVGGGSFVPKDLCSTGILTSRVLTAPSRATYTTAYI